MKSSKLSLIMVERNEVSGMHSETLGNFVSLLTILNPEARLEY